MQYIPIPLSMSTVYLIPLNESYLQVDTGYAHDYAAYRKGLQNAGIPLRQIRYLFLTHHHDDHAGFLNQITFETPVVIIANKKSRALLLEGRNDTSRGGGYVSRPIAWAASVKMRLDPRWTLSFPPFRLRESDIIIDGDDDIALRRLRLPADILYTPGHTIDHQVLLLDGGDVFCGDAASSMLLFLGARHCTVFMTRMDEAYRSWQKLLAAGVKMLYPAHGRPFPADRLKADMGKIKDRDLIKFF